MYVHIQVGTFIITIPRLQFTHAFEDETSHGARCVLKTVSHAVSSRSCMIVCLSDTASILISVY